mgnify:CR=1 FL=1
MGRSDYLVTAGIGFDLDRSSAKKSVGIFESVAGTINTIATKSAAKSFKDTEKEYNQTIKNLQQTNTQADADLLAGTEKSVKAAQDALDKSRARAPSKMSKSALAKLGMTRGEYEKDYKRTVDGIKNSYKKFTDEAEKIGIKFSKKGKLDLEEFAKKDAETRKRAINLTKRMLKDEKKRLSTLSESSEEYKTLQKEIKALAEQEEALVNINEDRVQLEKQNQQVHRQSTKEERAAEKKKITAQKRIQLGLKNTMNHVRKLGRLTQDSAAQIKGGLTNAFVIGTAAAGAFFYKMQPLAEQVTEFEKTLINANSVFNVSKKELFEVSDTMVSFTLKYGVAAQDTATGLYQLASAGLSAAESQVVLQSTMKLAMATQGDHNTLAKLTVQTIAGFGMEMSETGELTDKFAHSIQKSLIEWQDLASSVKFAMPFFVATGQSVDELLGGLEVLTNRALEAGIAGRGLRQALAQFAKHADDNSSALARLGVQIMDTEGNMRDLHEIAKDASAAFGDVTDLEALTAMLEDMNVRGATAFALLVQNAEEFEGAVEDISNAAGSATKMADIQQQSLANQIQLVKNALLAPFLFADDVGKANNTLNEFTFRISELVQQFVDFFIIIENGEEKLTHAAGEVKQFVLDTLEIAVQMVERFKTIFLESEEGITGFSNTLRMAVVPLEILLDILSRLEPHQMNFLIKAHMYNKILPITNMLQIAGNYIMMKHMALMAGEAGLTKHQLALKQIEIEKQWELNMTYMSAEPIKLKRIAMHYAEAMGLITLNKSAEAMILTNRGLMLSMGVTFGLFAFAVTATDGLAYALMGLASIIGVLAIIKYIDWGAGKGPPGWIASGAGIVAMFATMIAARAALRNFMGGVDHGGGAVTGAMKNSQPSFSDAATYDSGGTFLGGSRMYDTGGPTTEHGMAILQKGETVIPKTRNMLDGGITLNIGGDIVTDNAEDFAERIAAVLPEALRRQSDIGGI